MKYEIEAVNFGDDLWFESEISMLTGLDLEEITKHTQSIKVWRGQVFVELFKSLGFNCNHRWIKFDKKTEYPCMMRCRKPGIKKFWYGFVYYDGYVYMPDGYGKITWSDWNFLYPNFKITSMLQVWIDINTVINQY